MNTLKQGRKLGNTDITITPVGIGVMQFAGGKGMFKFMFDDFPQTQKDAIIKAGLDGGINWFDTAEMYGQGRSEQGLSNALKNNHVADEDVRIATKWWPLLRTARNIPKTIEDRLHYLQGYTIDLYQVHQPFSFSTPEDEMNAMADLVEAGKIRSVGISNFSAKDMHRAHQALVKRGLGLASNQVQFSLIDRQIETNGILDAAKELGVTIIAWSPLASGLLTGKFHKNPDILAKTPLGRRMRLSNQLKKTQALIDAMDEIAQKYDVSITQVALNWTVNFHGETVVAIPGASKVHHAQEAAGVLDFRLTDEEMAKLDRLSQMYR